MSEKQFTLRPQCLDDFIGQDHLKEPARQVIKAACRLNEAVGHTLLTGPAGLGKSTFAQIVANERKVDCHTFLGCNIAKPEDLYDVLYNSVCNEGYSDDSMNPVSPELIRPSVIFIDEVHQLPKRIRETLYTVMEDRLYYVTTENRWGDKEIQTCWVPKFTLIAATTSEGVLEKPFLDRFQNKWKFERYSDKQCEHFVRRAVVSFQSQQQFSGSIEITDEAVAGIAQRSRGTARVAIALTTNVLNVVYGIHEKMPRVDAKIVETVFEQLKIDKHGLQAIDYRILRYVANSFKPCGVKAIATALEETVDSIERVYEPFLVEKGFIQRTPSGRIITPAGLEYINGKAPAPRKTHRVLKNDG